MITRTSVVMATYNGVKYLRDQMDSLRDQTRPIDEVIIMDDCSSDGTIEFVENYLRDNNLVSWKLIKNESNKGWKNNFKLGFDQAIGDYIFPCDQDDIWHLDKCKAMIDVMENNPQINLLVSNYEIFFSEVDKKSQAYTRTSKQMVDSGTIEILKIDHKWAYVNRPGCCFCFRRSFYDKIKTSWNDEYAHDAILWRYAFMNHSLGLINKPLIDFRRHGDNTTSKYIRNLNSSIKTFESYISFSENAIRYASEPDEIRIYNDTIEFFKLRKKMYLSRNIFMLPNIVIKYRRCYLSYRGILGDIYFCLFGDK